MPQLDTTYFISQLFWLTILFISFFGAIKYIILPKIESIIQNRVLVKEDSESLKKKYSEEIAAITEAHKAKAEEARIQIKKLQNDSSKKFEDFCNKSREELKNKLDKKIYTSQKEIDKFIENFDSTSDYKDLVQSSAVQIINKISNSKIDDAKLKKYME